MQTTKDQIDHYGMKSLIKSLEGMIPAELDIKLEWNYPKEIDIYYKSELLIANLKHKQAIWYLAGFIRAHQFLKLEGNDQKIKEIMNSNATDAHIKCAKIRELLDIPVDC